MAGSQRIISESAVTTIADTDVLYKDNPTTGSGKIAGSDLKTQFEIVARKGVASGYAPLDSDNLIPAAHLRPSYTIETVADATARDALVITSGEVGKRLVSLTSTGVVYMANATGSGSSKWTVWNSMATATTSAQGVVQLATAAVARDRASATNALTPSTGNDLVADLRNALMPRGGIFFDGTSGANIATVSGAAAAIYTYPRSVVWGMRVGSNPTSDTEFARVAEDASPTSNYLRFVHGSGGSLKIRLIGTSASEYLETSWSGLSGYAGSDILCAFVADSSGRKLYVNGVEVTLAADTATASPPSDWQGAIGTGAAGILRFSATSLSFGLTTASLYNLALTAADVEEIYFLGGEVPFRFQFGSQTELVVNGDMSSDTGWSVGSFTIGSGVATAGGTGDLGTGTALRRDIGAVRGKAYRTTFTLAGRTSGTVEFSIGGVSGSPYATVRSANGTYTETAICGSSTGLCYFLNTLNVGATVDDASVKRVGAVIHLPLNDGIGYQLHDASTNKLDAVMTTTGVSHLIARREGYVRGTLTWAGTHEAKSLIGQRCFPNSTVLTLLTTKATAATTGSGASCGTSSFPGYWWTGTRALTTVKTSQAIGGPVAYTDAAADNDLVFDPDTANYTGSITIEARYAVTEGVY